jgi:hypothetical protein
MKLSAIQDHKLTCKSNCILKIRHFHWRLETAPPLLYLWDLITLRKKFISFSFSHIYFRNHLHSFYNLWNKTFIRHFDQLHLEWDWIWFFLILQLRLYSMAYWDVFKEKYLIDISQVPKSKSYGSRLFIHLRVRQGHLQLWVRGKNNFVLRIVMQNLEEDQNVWK